MRVECLVIETPVVTVGTRRLPPQVYKTGLCEVRSVRLGVVKYDDLHPTVANNIILLTPLYDQTLLIIEPHPQALLAQWLQHTTNFIVAPR